MLFKDADWIQNDRKDHLPDYSKEAEQTTRRKTIWIGGDKKTNSALHS